MPNFILLLGAVLFWAACAQAGQSAPGAEAAFASGHFDRAKSLFTAESISHPKDARAWARLGSIDLLDDKVADADAAFRRSLSIDPKDHAAKRGLQDAMERISNSSAPIAAPVVVNLLAVDPLPVVKVVLNGTREAYFLLDTGAPTIVLDATLAEQLGAVNRRAGSGVFAGGRRAQVGSVDLKSVSIGGARLENVRAAVLPMAGAPHPDGMKIEGLVGTGFFYAYLTTIDYSHHQLVLAPKSESARFEKTARDRGAAIARLWYAPSHFLFVRARVNRKLDGLFNVDTGGAGVGVQLSAARIADAGVVLERDKAQTVTGGGGEATIVPFKTTVELAGHEWTDVPGVVTQGGDQYGIFPFRVDGSLSHELFKTHAITFDFVAMKFVVE